MTDGSFRFADGRRINRARRFIPCPIPLTQFRCARTLPARFSSGDYVPHASRSRCSRGGKSDASRFVRRTADCACLSGDAHLRATHHGDNHRERYGRVRCRPARRHRDALWRCGAGKACRRHRATGAYRFPSLAPGTYTLTFALAGFTTLSREDVSVPLGGTVEINVQLKVSALAETVTVSGEQPVVDTTTAQVGTNFNRNWVENAPQRRFTFFDLINQAAGVSPTRRTANAPLAFGGNSTDNSYQLDGTDFTAPLTGAAWPWPNTDAIEEVEVLSLGASAEYGNVQGAVFNVVTRQGSNAFHGDGNFYFQHDNLTSRNTTDAQDDEPPLSPRQLRRHDLAGRRPDHEGQVLVLRVVPVPEGFRLAGG